jgi:hypothetical protein
VAEQQRRQQLKKIFKLVLLAAMFCSLYLWWIEFFITVKSHLPKSVVFPVHARFDFFDNSVHNVSRVKQRITSDFHGLKLLSWNDVTQPESYYKGVHPLHNMYST